MHVQLMDSSRKGYTTAIDPAKNTIALTTDSDKKWEADFTYARKTPDQLTLDGEVAGHKSTLALHRLDEKKLQLLSRGFHWIQDYPFNR